MDKLIKVWSLVFRDGENLVTTCVVADDLKSAIKKGLHKLVDDKNIEGSCANCKLVCRDSITIDASKDEDDENKNKETIKSFNNIIKKL